MRFGSLFSGGGGLDLGLEDAGMECAFQVEINPYANRVLERHWRNIPRWRDIREVSTDDLPPIGLLAGGLPCQPHSIAGKRLASEDERDLWDEFVRIIRGTKPRWIVVENVPGLLSSEAGRYFGRVLRDLAQLGFDAEWALLSACALGAPHTRERLFIVAHAHGERREECDAAALPILSKLGDWRPATDGDYWRSRPRPLGVADGVADRAHRVRLAGNGVVRQVGEYVGRLILAADAA
jgi:DNA (cytosine-5)-methyltransferase 1